MLLEVKNLTIEFHDHGFPERVVDDVSFYLEEGGILGIVGESGSGKSMTALAIAGLLSRNELTKKGEILFDGKNLLTLPRKELREYQGRDISMIFQEPMTALNPTMKIGKQVGEALDIHTELSKDEIKDKVIKILEKVELRNPEKVYEMYPHELSGGMRQRVMIAAAMISEPALLIADEPTTALDVTVQKQIIDLLIKLNKEENMAILFISHDLSLIKSLCKDVLVMYKGKIVEVNDTEDIFNNPKVDYTKKLIGAIPKINV